MNLTASAHAVFSGATAQAASSCGPLLRQAKPARWVSTSGPKSGPSTAPAISRGSRGGPSTNMRKSKAEWKRKQEGQAFIDHAYVTITAGKGGDGCVAFHREKFRPNGPPAGGNGSQGGSVYIRAVSHLTSLAPVPSRVRAPDGRNGRGAFMSGAKVPDTFIDVPVGTVVREVPRPPERLDETGGTQGVIEEERERQEKAQRWVHYPGHHDQNQGSPAFMHAEHALLRQQRAMRREQGRALRDSEPLNLDLDLAHDSPLPSAAQLPTALNDTHDHQDIDKSYYDRPPTVPATLLVSGGLGGFGNAHFATGTNRSPKFASRGLPGQRMTLELELKLLADLGLVGLPNAGKSTVLSALTRAKARVAPYAFTTINPQVGYVRVWEDGSFDMGDEETGGDSPARVHVGDGHAETPSGGRSRSRSMTGYDVPKTEAMRFTIADNPGLLAGASDSIGLGHSFLRSIERSLALVHVVDFSREAPWDDVEMLRAELEAYKPGLSQKGQVILANKADLAVPSSSFLSHGEVGEEQVQAAQAKLRRLRSYASGLTMSHGHGAEQALMMATDPISLARTGSAPDSSVAVIPISAKYRQNLGRAVLVLASLVRGEREKRRSRGRI